MSGRGAHGRNNYSQKCEMLSKVEVFRKLFPILQRFQLRGKSQHMDWGSTLLHDLMHDLVLAVLLSYALSQLPKVNLKIGILFPGHSGTSHVYIVERCPRRGHAKAPWIIPVRAWGQREPRARPCLFPAASYFHVP